MNNENWPKRPMPNAISFGYTAVGMDRLFPSTHAGFVRIINRKKTHNNTRANQSNK